MRLRYVFPLFCLTLTVGLSAVGAPPTAASSNPFRGLFDEWENRRTPQEEYLLRHRQLAEDVAKACPGSSPADIRKFMSLFETRNAIDGFSGNAASAPCADPWAEAVRALRLVASDGKYKEGLAALHALAEKLPPGDILRTHLLFLELALKEPWTPEFESAERKLVADIEVAVLSGNHHGSSVYLFYYNILAQAKHCGSRYWSELEQRLKPVADRIDPWFLAMVRGRAAVFWAWEGRGGDWAYKVTPEGWKEFHGNLDEARKQLYRAAELFPERVSPYIRLITVEMGSGDRAAMIDAFRKLVRYDAANEAGWDAVMWGLQPRWGGSQELMKMLAVAALECPRRDVGVAESGYRALSDIARYYPSYRWQNVYLDPAVRDPSDRLFAEYAKKLKRRDYLGFEFLRRMALLQYDEAAASYREFMKYPIPRQLRIWHFGLSFDSRLLTPYYDDPFMRLKVFTGSHAARLRAAERLYLQGGDDETALRELAGVIRDGGLPPEERSFLIELYGKWRLDREPQMFRDENDNPVGVAIVARRLGRADVVEEIRNFGYRHKERFPGETAYNIALESDDAKAMTRCAAEGGIIDALDPEYGYAPIHVAAMYGRRRIVEALLDLGVPVEACDRDGHTALQIAATKKQARVISVLFARGADPNAQDGDGDFCLIYLPQVRAPERIYRMFVEHPKIKVNLRNHAGESAMHYMAAFGTPPSIWKVLIAAGADVDLRDNQGRTPLDVAEEKGNRETAEFLRSIGAKRGAELAPVAPPPPQRQAAPPPSQFKEPPKYWYWGGGALVVLLILVLVIKRRNG